METENASAEISCQSVSGGGSWQMLATVSTASPVSQADVGLLFWRFSGGGGFSYDQLEASCCQVCFSAASSSPWMIEVVHMVSVAIWYIMIQLIFINFHPF